MAEQEELKDEEKISVVFEIPKKVVSALAELLEALELPINSPTSENPPEGYSEATTVYLDITRKIRQLSRNSELEQNK